MLGHKDKNKKFIPHGNSNKGIREEDLNISVKGSNDVIKVESKNLKPSTNSNNDQNYFKKLVEVDEEWNRLHGEPKHHHIFGEVQGHPDIDYVYLMKRTGLYSEPNYKQWKKDGHTDKEIYDILKKYANTLKEQNKERMGKISQKNRERVWKAMGGIKNIDELNYDEQRKLWQEHGKYPYVELE